MDADRLPALVVPMHEILNDELEAREWSPWELSTKMKWPYPVIVELCKGNYPLDHECAEALAKVFGTSSEFWENLDRNYKNWIERRQRQ